VITASPPELTTLYVRLERLYRADVKWVRAIGKLAREPLSQIAEDNAIDRLSEAPLLERLNAAHHCRRKGDAGFEELQRRAGQREWRCKTCGKRFTIERA
jgi:hypothetical protein